MSQPSIPTDQIKRLAIFVEGKTEMLFIERLVKEVAGRHNIRIETRSISGGTTVPRSYVTLVAAPLAGNEKFFVLIVDCQGDQQVKTRIVEEHQNLNDEGYEKIIGIRDVFPDFTADEIPKLRIGLRTRISGKLIPVEFILSVMEIEAWFIAETSHFSKIDASLTIPVINAVLSSDITGDVTKLPSPAASLNKIYDIVGLEYKKGAEETIEKLDYAHMYMHLGSQISDVDNLMKSLDKFLI